MSQRILPFRYVFFIMNNTTVIITNQASPKSTNPKFPIIGFQNANNGISSEFIHTFLWKSSPVASHGIPIYDTDIVGTQPHIPLFVFFNATNISYILCTKFKSTLIKINSSLKIRQA
jgi:hypothetical protein